MSSSPRDICAGNAPEHKEILQNLDRLAGSLAGHDLLPHCVLETVNLLTGYRDFLSPQEWRNFAIDTVRTHSIVPLLHHDPFSGYSFRRPRGYPGDAVLMDLIYGGGSSLPLVEAASDLGRELYRQAARCPSFAAVPARRDYLAERIAERCAMGRSHILAVACGHLRELQRLPDGCRPHRIVAIDQDTQSLSTAQADLSFPIEAVGASAFRLLTDRFDIGRFDFIYSAGLYDYLDDEFATRLLRSLAHRLAPGGTLLVANMLPGFQAAGYMEAIMDWWLIYRSAAEMESLAHRAVGAGGFAMKTFVDSAGYIVFLEIRRERSAAQ